MENSDYLLTNSNSDKFQFWQIPILTNSDSDKFQFWQIPILTNSNFFKKWQKWILTNSNSDKFRSPSWVYQIKSVENITWNICTPMKSEKKYKSCGNQCLKKIFKQRFPNGKCQKPLILESVIIGKCPKTMRLESVRYCSESVRNWRAAHSAAWPKFGVTLRKCNVVGDIGPNLENFFTHIYKLRAFWI